MSLRTPAVRLLVALILLVPASLPAQDGVPRDEGFGYKLADPPSFGLALDTVRFEPLDIAPAPPGFVVQMLYYGLVTIVIVISLYTLRHYVFTINRIFGRQRHPYADILSAQWPPVVVFVPAHNEEAVIGDVLTGLIHADYPREMLRIIPVNDRSTDRTAEIIDSFAARYPDVVIPFHRTEGKPGKAAALKDASTRSTSDIQIVFDADYIPTPRLLKQLVAPFFDPEVGAVMGRVVPRNSGRNFLTRLLELERSGGYQVDQQARMNLRLVPQYGGTVGGVRLRALNAVGGWEENSLAEDTDLTYRLLLRGYITAYQNSAECYEEVPEEWPVRIRQIRRWASGHNGVLVNFLWPLLRSDAPRGVMQKIDGVFLLSVFALAPLTAAGWVVGLILFYMGYIPARGFIAVLTVSMYSAFGNFAAFFQVGAAMRLDGARGRARLLPTLMGGFLVSLTSIIRSLFPRDPWSRGRKELAWDKTERYRPADP